MDVDVHELPSGRKTGRTAPLRYCPPNHYCTAHHITSHYFSASSTFFTLLTPLFSFLSPIIIAINYPAVVRKGGCRFFVLISEQSKRPSGAKPKGEALPSLPPPPISFVEVNGKPDQRSRYTSLSPYLPSSLLSKEILKFYSAEPSVCLTHLQIDSPPRLDSA